MKTPSFKLKAPAPSEHQIQSTGVDYFKRKWPHYHRHIQASLNGIWISGGQSHKDKVRKFREIAKAKAAGMVVGQSDLFIAVPRGYFAGMFVEVKKPGGRESENQAEFGKDMQRVGYHYEVAKGIDQLIMVIDRYMALDNDI